jgi:YHS domain-containing protein
MGFSLIAISCSNETIQEKQQFQTKEMTVDATNNSIDVSAIKFASKKDTICGMPIKIGVADTLNINGKVYGFCAVECKEAFKQQLAKK